MVDRMAEGVDGRRLRREQNRAAIVETLLALYAEGRYDATAAEVAERAGLSPRSLFRYFDDTDDLSRAAIEHEQARARPLLRIAAAPDDDLDTRIAALVAARMQMWDLVGPGARAARMKAPVSPAVAAELRQARAFLRHQAAELFAGELAARGDTTLAAVDVLCSFESIELLLHDHRLSRARAAAVLTESLRALLAPSGGPR
jgi:AcrR family transcriptional regulator